MLARTILFVLLLMASVASAQEWELLRTPAVHGFTEMAHDGTTLYAVADREYGIFSSQDNGISWQPRWPGLRMYVAQGKYYRVERDTVHRLFTSDNQGLTWQDEGALPVPINQFPPHLTISAQGDVYCYIRDIVFRRLAGQSSWQSIHNQPNETVRAAHIYGDHIWVQTDTWLLQSLDNGLTFTYVPISPQGTLGLAGKEDSVVCMFRNQSFEATLGRTVDGGQSWEYKVAPADLVLLQKGAFPCYALDYKGNWWRSDNGWDNWEKMVDRIGSHNPRAILALSQGRLISTDNGILHENFGAWRYAWHGYNNPDLNEVSWLSMAGDTLLCFSGSGSQTAYSADQGNTWQLGLSGYLPKRIFDLGTHYGGILDNDILIAAKGSQFNWQKVYYPTPAITPFLGFGTAGTTLYAADYLSIYTSNQSNITTWQQTQGKLPGDVMLVVNNELLTRVDSSILVSTDGGVTWKTRKKFDFPINSYVSRFYTLNNHVYLSQAEQRKIFDSADGGFTFSELPIPQDAGPFFQFRVHSNTMLLNTLNPSPTFSAGSLYISKDLGQSWCDIGFPNATLLNQGFSSYMDNICAHDGTVYMRSFYGQIWRKNCQAVPTLPEPQPLDWKFALTPNPGADNLYIGANEEQTGRVQIRMYDALGHLVRSETIDLESGAPAAVSTDDLKAGLYFIEIDGKWVGKWVHR